MAPTQKSMRLTDKERQRLNRDIREAQSKVSLVQHGLKKVRFSRSFPTFVQRTAHAIRHHVVYRSDKGRRARGLVQATGDLKAIHEIWLKGGVPEGHMMALYVMIWRRKDPSPGNRWALAVEFRIPPTSYEYEGDKVEADPGKLLRQFKADLLVAAAGTSGRQGRRVKAYVEFVSGLSLSQILKLWHYTPHPVHLYARSSEQERAKMYREAGGTYAGDGKPNYPLSGLRGKVRGTRQQWQTFPFKELWDRYGGNMSEERLRRSLLVIDSEIHESWQNQWDYPGTIAGSETGMREHAQLWYHFRFHHMKALSNKSDHLYYLWKRNTEFK